MGGGLVRVGMTAVAAKLSGGKLGRDHGSKAKSIGQESETGQEHRHAREQASSWVPSLPR